MTSESGSTGTGSDPIGVGGGVGGGGGGGVAAGVVAG